MSAFAYRMSQPILLEHCDAAGWAFYPRYALFVNRVVEEAFGEGLGWPFDRMHLEEHLGVPTVDLHMQFRRPSRLGEVLDITLTADSVGTSSCTFALDFRVAGEDAPRIEAKVVLVHVALGDPPETRPWPPAVAATLRGETA